MPIATTVRTGISIFTYCDDVTFGVTGISPNADSYRPLILHWNGTAWN